MSQSQDAKDLPPAPSDLKSFSDEEIIAEVLRRGFTISDFGQALFEDDASIEALRQAMEEPWEPPASDSVSTSASSQDQHGE